MFPTAAAIPLGPTTIATDRDLSTSTLPFAHGLRSAPPVPLSLHSRTTPTHTPSPPPRAPNCKNPSLPEPTEIGPSQRQPHAQKRFAAISQCARSPWLDGLNFGQASPAHRAIIVSQSHQGAMFAFTAVPNGRHGAMLPAMSTFVNAAQLRLHLPLSLLAGATT